MKEEWKDIKGFEGRYQVSSLGRIRSIRTKFLKLSPASKDMPYYRVALYKSPKRHDWVRKPVHQIVAEAFVKKPDKKGLVVNHIDGNKHNNKPENLEWVTTKENNLHAIKNGLRWFYRGEDHPNAKLTEEQVKRIRKLRHNKVRIKSIAKRFGIAWQTVMDITNRKIWKHVP